MKRTREWWKSARIGKANDGRKRLTEEQKERIKALYANGKGIRQIAKVFDGICSRRLVQFVLFPERLKVVKERAKEVKRWEPYNRGVVRRDYMRKHRAKVKTLHEKGIIK